MNRPTIWEATNFWGQSLFPEDDEPIPYLPNETVPEPESVSLTYTICSAVPNIPLLDAVKIATALIREGFVRVPF